MSFVFRFGSFSWVLSVSRKSQLPTWQRTFFCLLQFVFGRTFVQRCVWVIKVESIWLLFFGSHLQHIYVMLLFSFGRHYINHYTVCSGVTFNVLHDNCRAYIVLGGENGVVMLPQNEKLISQRKIWQRQKANGINFIRSLHPGQWNTRSTPRLHRGHSFFSTFPPYVYGWDVACGAFLRMHLQFMAISVITT